MKQVYSSTLTLCAVLAAFAQPAYAQSSVSQASGCEVLLMAKNGPNNEGGQDGLFADASAFLEGVYDEAGTHTQTISGLPVRAVMCKRDQLAPSLRDYPILKTGVPLSISQDFDSRETGLLTIFDAGAEYKAEYSGPPLSPDAETKLREALEIFNLQKLAE